MSLIRVIIYTCIRLFRSYNSFNVYVLQMTVVIDFNDFILFVSFSGICRGQYLKGGKYWKFGVCTNKVFAYVKSAAI